MARITVTIPDELHEQLVAVAAASNRSLSNLVMSLLSDLGSMLAHVLQARTAGEASEYLDQLMAERESEAEKVRAELLAVVEERHDELSGPPSSNTGVRKK